MGTQTTETGGGTIALTAVLTLAMALPMLVLYSLGTLGPLIVDELGISRSSLGSLTAICFGVAALLSLWAGQAVDRIGTRLATLVLFTVVTVSFLMVVLGRGYPALFVAVGVCGIAQALANPATNKVIAGRLPEPARPRAVGIKQSGVQMAALAASLLLVLAQAGLGWRGAFGVAVPVAVVAGLLAVRLLPADRPQDHDDRRSLVMPPRPNGALACLMGYQLLLGAGLSAVATFLPLFAHQEVGTSELVAALLVAGFGVAGVIARIGWTSLAGRLADPSGLLLGLTSGAAVFVLAVLLSASGGPALTWVGAVGVGATAVAANAVSMLAVVRDRGFGAVAPSSALVSLAFFGGFAISPPLIGLVADTGGGFGPGWLVVAAEFVLAGLCAVGLRRARIAARRAAPVPPPS